ncbi:hypothetical protein Tco_0548984 [Tanacetum coccineum]
MDECDSMSTPTATARPNADLQGTPTDQKKYHSMIRGTVYLTASRPDISFATFNSSWHNNNNKEMFHKINCVHPTSVLILWMQKLNLVNPQCPNESKIIADILNNHPLRTCVAASASEITLTVADFRHIFRLPQATDNNHVGFVDALTFS